MKTFLSYVFIALLLVAASSTITTQKNINDLSTGSDKKELKQSLKVTKISNERMAVLKK